MAGKVVHFEIPIDDPDRASAFYGRVFGWNVQQFGPVDYWTTDAGTGEGIGGAFAKRSPDSPSLMVYISVDDLDAALASVGAAGGEALTEKMGIPTVGWMAFIRDTEGNRVGVFQADGSVPWPEGAGGEA